MASIFGTNTPDSLVGTQGADRLYGWDYGSSIWDTSPETDRDTLQGLGGADFLNGGNGRDRLYGGGGSDVLEGGDGVDLLSGGAGNDVMFADLPERALGGDGDDTISLDSYPDGAGFVLHGDAGNDELQIWGLHAGEITGGAGIDRLVFDLHDGNDGLRLNLADPDLVQVQPGGMEISGFEALSFDGDGAGGDDRITGGDLADFIIGGGGRDVIRGKAGQDTLGASGDQATLLGGSGDDDVSHWGEVGGFVGVLLDGGDGQDILRLSRETMTLGLTLSLADPLAMQTLVDRTRIMGFEQIDLWGGAGDDSVTGGALGDSIYGMDGNDILHGAGGNDQLSGAWGANQVFGDAGDDTLSGDGTLQGGEGNDLLISEDPLPGSLANGGAGIDTLEYSASFAPEGIELDLSDPGTAQTTAEGLTLVEIEQIDFHGSTFADRVTGGAFNDTLYGSEGDDTLRGGGGDDVFKMYSDQGADRLTGNGGTDLLIYYADWNTAEGISLADPMLVQTLSNGTTFQLIERLEFYGSGEADTITGGAQDDYIQAGDGANVLHGGAGNDVLDNEAETAQTWGEEGDDYVSGVAGLGALYDGGAGVDILHLYWSDLNQAIDLSFADPLQVQTLADGTVITGFERAIVDLGEAADHFVGGALNDEALSLGGNDTMLGGGGNDTLEAWSGNLRLSGGSGNDILQAGVGRDVLRGDEGDDRLFGGDGDDRLTGGMGNDFLDGGQGADRFIFDQAPLPPVVDYLIFHAGDGDRIELLGSAFAGLPIGALAPGAFALGKHATEADDRMVWDAETGRLWFDADGAGGQRKQLFLLIDADDGLQASDFLVV